MNDTSLQLKKTALEFLGKSIIDCKYTVISGSVGRGDADSFSDIDLISFTDSSLTGSFNFYYKESIVQLTVLPLKELPNKKKILDNPWETRYWLEMDIVQDVNDQLRKLQNWAMDYYTSDRGRRHVISHVKDIAMSRLKAASDYHENHQFQSARIAAVGAWTEVMLLNLFLDKFSSDVGKVVPYLQTKKKYFLQFQKIFPNSNNLSATKIIHIVTHFRKYLREEQGMTFEFGLSELQDKLFKNKASRHLKNKECFQLAWQAYSEILWLYFETSSELSMDEYFTKLPKEIQMQLSVIGFQPIDEEELEMLHSFIKPLIHRLE